MQVQNNKLRFKFGKNWQSYLKKKLSEEVLNESKKHFLSDIGKNNISGFNVLDIGSGSGIHSLSAIKSGAARVVSFDYDINSVEATKFVFRYSGSPENWTILQGSVLDNDFMSELGTFDLVYSWGVLHHTGDVWNALSNTIKRVNDSGYLYIGLYDPDCSARPEEYWLNIKQKYNLAGPVKQKGMEYWYILEHILNYNPLRLPKLYRYIKNYKKKRGMDFMHDVKDWLGGWPMEYCRLYDVIPFVQKENFSLTTIKTGEVVTEYVFKKNNIQDKGTRHDSIVPDHVSWDVNIIRFSSDFEHLSLANRIYIYGSGKGGEIVKKGLKKYLEKEPEAFIVTDNITNNYFVSNTRVVTFKEVKDVLEKGDVIILASKFYGEISCMLAKHGITKFYNAYPYVFANL